MEIDPTHSGIASLDPATREKFLSVICSEEEAKSSLRPLLLMSKLPARECWLQAIGQLASAEDWEALKLAVARVLFHQAQEATDCRWVRVLFRILSGKLNLRSHEEVREILEYPEYGEQKKVRPTIRAMEGALSAGSLPSLTWPKDFWEQCLTDTVCETRRQAEATLTPHPATTRMRVRQVREALAEQQRKSLVTTDVDTKHDAVFGLAAYSLGILDELISPGNSTSILGRIGLRTLLECFITLSYLRQQDTTELWAGYRQYGAGQAKLAFLKLDELSKTVPTSISVEVLEQLANEDRWQELVTIDLGHWANKDLRKMSEAAHVKPEYDALYPWTSAFTHGNWAAVRNSCFDLCVNPLHRLHRRVRPDSATLEDVIRDACEIVDRILQIVEDLYPGLSVRVVLASGPLSNQK
jgi:hypothetical protein